MGRVLGELIAGVCGRKMMARLISSSRREPASRLRPSLHPCSKVSSLKTKSGVEEPDPPGEKLWASVKYVIATYSISKWTVYDLLKKGIFRKRKNGRRTLIYLPFVTAWVNNSPDTLARELTAKATRASLRKRARLRKRAERLRKPKKPKPPKE